MKLWILYAFLTTNTQCHKFSLQRPPKKHIKKVVVANAFRNTNTQQIYISGSSRWSCRCDFGWRSRGWLRRAETRRSSSGSWGWRRERGATAGRGRAACPAAPASPVSWLRFDRQGRRRCLWRLWGVCWLTATVREDLKKNKFSLVLVFITVYLKLNSV